MTHYAENSHAQDFRPQRYRLSAPEDRPEMKQGFQTWPVARGLQGYALEGRRKHALNFHLSHRSCGSLWCTFGQIICRAVASYTTKKRVRRHCIVKHTSRRHVTTQRRKSRLQLLLDDSRPENTASAMLDDTPSSSRAIEGDLAAPSRRAPSHAMLDDGVSQKPPEGMLDGILPENTGCRRCSTASSGCYPE